MSESGSPNRGNSSWLSQRVSHALSYFSSRSGHQRLPSDDEDAIVPPPSQSGPSMTPQVPPSTPVSVASGSSSGSSNGRGVPTETAYLTGDREGTSSMTSPASGSRDMPRSRSLQRIIDHLNSMRQSGGGSSDLDDDGNGSRAAQGSGSHAHNHSHGSMSRTNSGLPVCLICLEPLTADDFESGEAMSLECQCKGDMGLRHRSCASKWVNVKGDLICDICHTPIGNLPPPLPRSDNIDEGAEDPSSGRMVGATDVFDCIRMTWVVTIVCILFFDFSIPKALLTGMVVAVLYTFSCQLMRCLYTRTGDAAGQQVLQQNPNLVNATPIIV